MLILENKIHIVMYKYIMNKETLRDIKTSSELVRISHKISSTTSEPQLIKIGDKYYRVKELG